MRDIWQNRALSLLGGGLIGVYLNNKPVIIKGLILIILILIIIGIQRSKPRDFWGKVYKPEFILLAATMVSGFLYGLSSSSDIPRPMVINKAEIYGIVVDLKPSGDHLKTTVRIEEIKRLEKLDKALPTKDVLGKYQLNIYPDKQGNWPKPWSDIEAGDYISTSVRLEWVQAGGTAGGFDPQLYYYTQGLKGKASLKGETHLVKKGSPPLTWLIRQEVTNQLKRFNPELAGIFEGILFGDTTNISSEATERYRVAGVWHVFAASGSNVAFVLALSWILFRFFPKIIRVGFTIFALVLYALLCGGNAPIVRATILGIAALLGIMGKGKLAGSRLLFLAGVGMFLFKPLWLKDIGFQLSFAATWGIIILVPYLQGLKSIKTLPSLVRTAIAITLASQIAVLPILITAFHRISIIGFITNVFILFILGAVLELGLLGVILSPFSAAIPFFQVGIWLIEVTDHLLDKLVKLPFSDVWIINPGIAFVLFWYTIIGVKLYGTKKLEFILAVIWRKVFSRFPSKTLEMLRIGEKISLKWMALLILLLIILSPWQNYDVLKVSFIDVGQGDAILIEGPEGQAILIDTGPAVNNFNAGEKIIIPYLLHKGIKDLEGLILTHGHEDHTGGAQTILENFSPNWIGIPDTEESELATEFLQDKNELKLLNKGDKIIFEPGIVIDVIAPTGNINGSNSDINNNSIVLSLRYGSIDVLLTGDIEVEGLEEIVQDGWFQEREIDVLKVPHHGSRYSFKESVWDESSPQIVVISVGKNSFGHPTKEVLTYWKERGIPVYRTDQQGTIELEVRPDSIEAKPGRVSSDS